MATGLSVIVDCNSDAFVYSSESGGSGWHLNEVAEVYKGTSWASGADDSKFVFLFEGTSVAFVGITSRRNQTTVQIDNGTVSRISYDTTPNYKTWFQSTKLSDGPHTITVRNLTTTEIDYAIVNVGNQTPLSGKSIVVDNDNPSILYSGHWSRNTSLFRSGVLVMGYPYGNSTHRTSTPGDTFTFRFTGTSISVYGFFSWQKLGYLAATFTVDSTTVSRTYNQTARSSWEEAPNFLYYSLDDLSAGDHTLIVNITAANNKTFMLDYITYTPSFATLASMPLLNANTTSPIASASTSLGNQSSSVQVTRLSQPSKKSLPIAAIVGGLIGALALGLLVAIIWLFLRRRKAKETEIISQYLNPPTDEWNYQNDTTNRNVSRKHHLQDHPEQMTGTSSTLNSPAQYHPTYGRAKVQATSPRLPPPLVEVVTEPPAYDTISLTQ